MKWISALFTAWLIFLNSAASSQDYFAGGARFQSLADASVALSGPWSVLGNQAGLAKISRLELAGSFQSRFMVHELSGSTATIAVPVQTSVFAFTFSQTGKQIFRRELLALSFARTLAPKINFGLQFNYYRLLMAEEASYANSVGFEMGIQYSPKPELTIGAHILNPYQTGVHTLDGTYLYPRLFGCGINYRLAEPFVVLAEIDHDFSSHLLVRAGFEYVCFEKFFIRTGVSGKPYLWSFGFGFELNSLVVDLAATYHQYLRYSPNIGFGYHF